MIPLNRSSNRRRGWCGSPRDEAFGHGAGDFAGIARRETPNVLYSQDQLSPSAIKRSFLIDWNSPVEAVHTHSRTELTVYVSSAYLLSVHTYRLTILRA